MEGFTERQVIVQGVSEGFHNAATALVEGDRILYASEAERHSRIKNDRFLGNYLRDLDADVRVFYEDVPLKNARRMAKFMIDIRIPEIITKATQLQPTTLRHLMMMS